MLLDRQTYLLTMVEPAVGDKDVSLRLEFVDQWAMSLGIEYLPKYRQLDLKLH